MFELAKVQANIDERACPSHSRMNSRMSGTGHKTSYGYNKLNCRTHGASCWSTRVDGPPVELRALGPPRPAGESSRDGNSL
jgi:hypothetical protein